MDMEQRHASRTQMTPNFRRDPCGIKGMDGKGSELVYHQLKALQ